MEKLYPSLMSGPLTIATALNLGKLREETFRISDTKIDSKIYHTWRMAGLVDMVQEKKWAKFSFVEYLWLQTLESMRKLGCSVKLMKAVHQELFKKAQEENLGEKNLKENIGYYKNLSKKRPLTKDEEDVLFACENTLKDDLLMKGIRSDITYFYRLVLCCFSTNNEVGLLIFEDQSFLPFYSWEQVDVHRSKPHILIPVSSFIKDFIADEEKDKFLVPVGLLTDDERRIISLIRGKNIEKLTIQFNDSREPVKYESEYTGIIKGDKAKEIMQILGLKNYSSIALKTRDGNTLSFTKSNKDFM
jgi:hypothetical protein